MVLPQLKKKFKDERVRLMDRDANVTFKQNNRAQKLDSIWEIAPMKVMFKDCKRLSKVLGNCLNVACISQRQKKNF